jgi:hypothetical protein
MGTSNHHPFRCKESHFLSISVSDFFKLRQLLHSDVAVTAESTRTKPQILACLLYRKKCIRLSAKLRLFKKRLDWWAGGIKWYSIIIPHLSIMPSPLLLFEFTTTNCLPDGQGCKQGRCRILPDVSQQFIATFLNLRMYGESAELDYAWICKWKSLWSGDNRVAIRPIYVRIVTWWPPLCSSGQSSWLQIRRLGFDSRHYQKKK